jgi:myosin tail region-interacting protein MTI1
MPAPVVPRRVAPPRRKVGKHNLPVAATSPPTIDSDEPASDILQDTDPNKFSSSAAEIDEATDKHDIPILDQEGSPDIDLGARSSKQPTHSEAEPLVDEELSDELPLTPSKPTYESISSLPEQLTEPAESQIPVAHQQIQSLHLGHDPELPQTDDTEGDATEEEIIEELAGIEQQEEVLKEDSVQKMEPLSAERHEAALEHDDDDRADRRTRIAERLAKSGGVNPFATGGGFASPLGRKLSTSTTGSRRGSSDHSDGPLSRSTSIRSSPPIRRTSADLSPVTTRAVETEDDGEGDS